mgnify:FL=1
MGSNGANPGLMKDPWKPDDVCLAAVFGQDSLLLGSGDWGENGYLVIGPRKKEKLPKDHYLEHNQDQQFAEARINGPGILLLFPKPEDARDVARMLMTIADDMEKLAKSRRMDDVTKEPNDGTK